MTWMTDDGCGCGAGDGRAYGGADDGGGRAVIWNRESANCVCFASKVN